MRLLTASALERVEKCPPSHSLPWAREEFEAGTRGTVLHTYCVTAAIKGREAALAECPEEWRTEAQGIDVTALPHATGGYIFEVAFAYNAEADTARELGRDVKSRAIYAGVNVDTEVGGTADLVGLTPDEVVILDLKTGRKWLPLPAQSNQLQFLALAASRVYRRSNATVGWIRLVDNTPRLIVETMGPLELEEARDRLQAIRERAAKFAWLKQKPEAKVNVSVGDWCRYCPALRGCWAHTSAIPDDDSDPVQHVEHLERAAELARKQLNMQAAQEPIKAKDGSGRVYGPRIQTRRTINAPLAIPVLKARHPALNIEAMSNITAADLKRAGLDSEKEMEALAAVGAVNVAEFEKMETHKP